MFLGHLSLSARLWRVFSCLAITVGSTQATEGQWSAGASTSVPSVISVNASPGLTPEQIAASLAELRAKAEKGDPVSQNRLGDLYGQGLVVKADVVEATKWYRKSAEMGYPPGEFNFGLACRNGEGMPQDYPAALNWYRKAAKAGFVPAQYNLGLMLLKGEGGKKDTRQGAQWIKKAAEHDDALAQVAIAGLYLNGEGFPVDKVEAFAWLSLVAQNPAYTKDAIQLTYQDLQKSLTPYEHAEALDRSKVIFQEIGKRLKTEKKHSTASSSK